MNSKNLFQIKNKLKKYLKDKEILDIILFGSFVKGKEDFQDIDIAVISDKKIKIDIPKFHVAFLSVKDFFINPPALINTLLREGYSIKNNKPFSGIYNFKSRVLFNYDLSLLTPSLKVKVVNALRGKKQEKGLVLENKGEWMANNVFLSPIENSFVFEKLFMNFKIKFKKKVLLIN